MAQAVAAYVLVGVAALWVAWLLAGRRLVIRRLATAGASGADTGGWLQRRLVAWAQRQAGAACGARCGGCAACPTPKLKVHRQSNDPAHAR